MKQTLFTIICACLASLPLQAQTGKLSSWLRHISTLENRTQAEARLRGMEHAPESGAGQGVLPADAPSVQTGRGRTVCAFIRISADADEVLAANGCRQLARAGNIYIADIPVGRLRTMVNDPRVVRIEARPSGQLLMDSMAHCLNAVRVYSGEGLPQAYTGKGVVMGVMDVGFDLTHPNFYNADATDYRIKAFWDMVTPDTLGSRLYVGRDFVTTEEMLAVAHSYDGFGQTHGTHTLGIAAGSGAGTVYRGMAPESDICLVSNAVGEDMEYIAPDDAYKYTFATDVLGFKYIFDYAARMGQPCVISFSEGSEQDFRGDCQLYYEMLDSLTGPGRIIVASAGNEGLRKAWFRKPQGQVSAGTFLLCGDKSMQVTLKSAADFDLRLVSHIEQGDTIVVPMHSVLEQPDSTLSVQLVNIDEQVFDLFIEAYPSCFNPDETCYDLTVTADDMVGISPPLSLEVLGTGADVEVYCVTGIFGENRMASHLDAAECTHTVRSPSSAPCVVSVGGTNHRPGITNYMGKWKVYEEGDSGERGSFSSVGPTCDGRIKPDVMAPGVNIISSYSSYYLEHRPSVSDSDWDVEHFDFGGRTYAWTACSGTSMSTPAVGGAIALWLQACPTLTPHDVMGVLQRTCRHYGAQPDYPNNEYGYGEIDVYAGLMDILGVSRIEGVSARQSAARLVMTAAADWRLTLPQAAARPLRLQVYALTGHRVAQQELPAGHSEYKIDLPRLAAGQVYVVQLDGEGAVAGSLLIRR